MVCANLVRYSFEEYAVTFLKITSSSSIRVSNALADLLNHIKLITTNVMLDCAIWKAL